MNVGNDGLEKRNRQRKKHNRILIYQGKEYVLNQFAREFDIPVQRITKYLNMGHSAEEALTLAKKEMWIQEMRKLRKA